MSRFPIISCKASDYLAVLSMSAPSEALFSRIGNIETKKREDICQERSRFWELLKSRGIITAEEMRGEISDTEEEENSTQLDGDGTTKLRQPKIIDVLERVDDTEVVTDDENDEKGIIGQVEEFMNKLVE